MKPKPAQVSRSPHQHQQHTSNTPTPHRKHPNMTSPAPRELRPYQREAVEAIESHWSQGVTRVGVVLPTGTGKSTVIGRTAVNGYQNREPVLMVAHRGELIDQMAGTIFEVDPSIPRSHVGIVRAEMDDHSAPIVVATLQTLATAHRREAVGFRRRILWDEVHHAGAEGFHTTFTELGGYTDALFAGFTATMRRDDKGKSPVGLGDVIEKVVYEKDILWAIDSGYLVRPRGLTVRINNLNALDDVRTVAGDFQQSDLAEVMEAATEYVVDAIKLHAADRRPIIFAASVDAAHHIADALTAADFPAVAVTGSMSYAERQPVYEAYRNGTAKALVTVQVLTEGADFPMCDCVVLARPTRSRNLYSQMIGRALRLYDGKQDALVLDLAGSSRSMKLVNLTQLVPGVDAAEVTEDGSVIEIEPDDELPGEGSDPTPKLVRQGPVEMVVIDLLSGSDVTWCETTLGVPFIPLMDDEIVFVWPKDGYRPLDANATSWAVATMSTKTGRGGWVSGSGAVGVAEPDYIGLEAACEAAEAWIVNSGKRLPSKKDSWRRKQPATAKQIAFARGLGIVGADAMTKAELSDEISTVKISRRLDRNITRIEA
ncbi:DNA helicase [Mycobacterium phage Mutante]|uniref:DNA helicase n=26 Tax=Pegunavirus TaxID=1623295 RepID=A0A345KXJ7_9CAUD|nr:DNA helicase [Mycobacterium phage Oline]YP_010096556.1 DNA helicase [Mycobacterium phage KingTut]AKF12400.1 helicase type III subunit [Mycobacterium phage PDRPv]AKF12505.1 helicase type III subunit [Mycobacterium phage PDRPxv]AOQ28613.1 DNA helicase [Mycobacterium phage Derpp]AOQ28714.1 DNA helicase [Mycobacterium phage TyrionL]AOQ28814.1 DNA helicase [Mycobacterium phage CharlieGBrown]AOQ29308.1 DNA helicase [Mycobacterium phage Pinkman]AOT23524.1 DNA helicase [Mycobacterium phage Irido